MAMAMVGAIMAGLVITMGGAAVTIIVTGKPRQRNRRPPRLAASFVVVAPSWVGVTHRLG
jgi:hypothetical protein